MLKVKRYNKEFCRTPEIKDWFYQLSVPDLSWAALVAIYLIPVGLQERSTWEFYKMQVDTTFKEEKNCNLDML